MATYDGRLELTWTNKHLRLLAYEDGSYEWVPSPDYRVAEVRLLHDAAAIGEVGSTRAADNLLIRGDALNALTSLWQLPEFAAEYVGKVKLAYLDPPFNTSQSFLHYDDALEHSVWLTMMRDRLVQIQTLLASDGSVWVHCDDSEQAHLRVLMDEVFGPACFVASVVWRSTDNSNNDAKQFSQDHNLILVYSREPEWRSYGLPRTESQAKHYANPDSDPRGPWFDGNPIGSPNPRENLRYDVVSPTGHVIKPPANGWRWSRNTLEAKMATGEVRFSDDGTRIVRRTYLADQGVLPPSTLWADIDETGSNRQAKYELKRLFGGPSSELFDTPKPERLMKRIIELATRPGDVVLDCFLGSGTTAAVAHKLSRRWIGIERSREVIQSFAVPRLEKVVRGEDPGGVTTEEVPSGEGLPDGVRPGQAKSTARVLDLLWKASDLDGIDGLSEASMQEVVRCVRAADKVTTETRWQGGGGFRVLDVAPSMFEAEDGLVFLADWMTNSSLAEATAAQLGFGYEDDPPFAGRKGRARLAVVDGVVNESVVRILASVLPDGERVVVCGTSIDTEARPILRELRPGSTLRKIPSALLDEYRSARQINLIPVEAGTKAASNGDATFHPVED